MATLVGLIIGAGLALTFWIVTLTGLDRLNQGMLGTLGLIALIALCLAFDGWILVAIAAFVAAMVCLLLLQTAFPFRRS